MKNNFENHALYGCWDEAEELHTSLQFLTETDIFDFFKTEEELQNYIEALMERSRIILNEIRIEIDGHQKNVMPKPIKEWDKK